MNKSNHFSGQLTFAQLIKLLPKDLVARCIEKTNSDYYYKKFNTWHHLVTMLFTCYGHCHSLREVTTGMKAFEGRLQGCGIQFFPARSTFAEANAKRDSAVFEEIFMALKSYWMLFTRTADRTGNRYMLSILQRSSYSKPFLRALA